MSSQGKIIKQRKANKLLRTRNTKNGLEVLEKLLQTCNLSEVVVRRGTKCKSHLQGKPRRSNFIGVSKNGEVWQSLIMIDKKKTYIGSYATEEEAALSYDFFAILLKQFSANTNFDYTAIQVKRMVENYKDNEYELIPSSLLQ
uniref:AP2/ERF domain-containing protein n=1 Tax=Euplotes harpa TaxID=151035 RepID=A0A7S3JLI9_9SPIT|mmetsp:Transcript_7977/g.9061  ORF Transcript_7977/g.9061 Transcript_7977/m.9061 type:complete len:143 (+) Transcript_7977:349-777(+)